MSTYQLRSTKAKLQIKSENEKKSGLGHRIQTAAKSQLEKYNFLSVSPVSKEGSSESQDSTLIDLCRGFQSPPPFLLMNWQVLPNTGGQPQERGMQQNPLADQELLTPRHIELLPKDKIQMASTLTSLTLNPDCALDIPGLRQWDSGEQSDDNAGKSEGDTTIMPTGQVSQTRCDTPQGSADETVEPRERLNFQFSNQGLRPRSQASSDANDGLTDDEI